MTLNCDLLLVVENPGEVRPRVRLTSFASMRLANAGDTEVEHALDLIERGVRGSVKIGGGAGGSALLMAVHEAEQVEALVSAATEAFDACGPEEARKEGARVARLQAALDGLSLEALEMQRAQPTIASDDDIIGTAMASPFPPAPPEPALWERADWARAAIDARLLEMGCDLGENEPTDSVCDTITDLLHLAEEIGMDVSALLVRATRHYAAEQAEGQRRG